MHLLRRHPWCVTSVIFGFVLVTTLRAQTGSPTSSQNQGTRPVGTSIAVPGTPTTLFAYGSTTTTDIAAPKSDDGYADTSANAATAWLGTGPEGSSLTMAFLNHSYGGLFINTNGNLSFGASNPSFSNTSLASSSVPLLAPFLADVDLRGGTTSLPSGNIWYRTTQNATELASITARLSATSVAPQNFNPTFAQIVTWDKVGRYSQDNTNVSTFQTVLIGDGVRTYALFLYPENAIWWDNGSLTEQAGTFARVGYSAGNGVTGYEVAGSGTPNARDLSITSNTGQPGTFVFDVGGTQPPVVVNGTLTLPSAQGTAASVLQLSANAAGHTITSTAAAGSILFNQLTFADPTNTVAFTDKVVALANSANAITAGNLTFANNAVLVAQAASALNGGTLTLKDSAKLALYAEGATTAATALNFNKTSGTGGTLDLRGFNTAVGAVNSTGTTAGVITNSGATAGTLTFGGVGTGNFNGVLQNGTGLLNLAKTGTGTQILSGANTYTGTTNVSGGVLQFAKTSAFYSGTIDATSAAKLTAQTGGTAAFNVGGTGEFSAFHLATILGNANFSSGALGLDTTNATGGTFTLNANPGAGIGLVKLGPGILSLAGTNPNLGAVTVQAGTLQLGDSGNSVSDTGAVSVNSGTFRLGAANETIGALTGSGGIVDLFNGAGRFLTVVGNGTDTTYAGSIQGTGGSLVKVGSYTLTLTGDNSYTGDTLLGTGTLQIGNGGSSGSLAGNVTNNAALVFNRADALTFAGVISGTGTLEKLGAGTLTLSNTNTFTGVTSISAGRLQLGHSLALQGSTLNYQQAGTLGFGALTAVSLGGLTGPQALFLANDTTTAVSLTVGGNGASTTYAGSLSGPGSLTKTGAGTLTLSGINTYTGGTTLAQGTLNLSNYSALGPSGTITFAGGTLQFSPGATTDYSSRFSTSPNQSYRFDTNGQFVTLSSGLTSTGGSLTKSGAGTLRLTAANTYTGDTTIEAGILRLEGAAAGAVAGNIVNHDTLLVSLGSNPATAFTYAGAISGTGAFAIQGLGNYTLSGANTYTGGTTFCSGTLALGSAGALGSTGTLSFAGGTLQFSAANTTDYSARFSTAASQSYRFDTNGQDVTLASALTSANGSLTKLGAGTLTLSGANTYTGGTTLSAGTLALGSSGALGSTGTLSFTGGILQFSAANTIDYSSRFGSSTNQLYHLDTNGQNVTLATALLSSGGSLTKSGAGILTLGGTNAYTGGTTINAGTLQIGAGGASGSLTGNITNNGALAFNRSNAFSFSGLVSGTGSLTQLGAGPLTLTATHTYAGGTTVSAGVLQLGDSGTVLPDAGTVTVNGGTLRLGAANETIGSLAGTGGAVDLFNTSGRTLTVNQTADTTFAGLLQGNGGALVKNGPGSLTLAGNNTYSGGTTLSAGTLQIGNGGTSGSLASGNIVNSAALSFNRSDAFTHAGVISGTGSLTKLGAGTLTLTGNNTYTGATTISTGTLQIGNGGTTGSVAGNIANNAALVFNRSDALTHTGVISGSGTLTKLGTGSLTLAGTNTYTGATTVSEGTLQIGNGGTSGSLAKTALSIASGASVRFDRSTTSTFAGSLSGTGTLIKTGAGNLTFTGSAPTFNGPLQVTQGLLILASAGNAIGDSSPVSISGGASVSISGGDENFGSLSGAGTLLLANRTFGVSHTGTVEFSGTITDSGAVNKGGSGNWILSGANTYVGPTTLNLGTLTAGSATAFGSGTVRINAGTLNLDNQALANALDVRGGTVTGLANYTGTQTLSTAMTYSGTVGGTMIIASGGALNTTGATFTGNTTVQSGGLVSGTGSLGPLTLSSGATIDPGNSPGTLTFTDGLTFNSGTIIDLELGNLSDLIRVTGGTLAGPGIDGGITLNLTDSGGFTPGVAYTFLDATGASSLTSIGATSFAIGTGISGYSFSLNQLGSTFQLTATSLSAVPEPSTWAALVGLLMLGFAAWRRLTATRTGSGR